MFDSGAPVDLREEHMCEWRDARDRALGAYRAWCAAARSDRRTRRLDFVRALRQEERAAQQVARSARERREPAG